ncbi:hypothetical protein ACFXPS_30835 [Nocardia sp. NPDC059091]|uniref:hypothetical protein n=1 Tax=Nocardia sp. NPDC059091 TaxID=3346724 RepID=UPI0036C1B0F5
MPKRTNLFQQVIHTVYSHLSENVEVKESAMLRDRGTGQLREVDTTIETMVAGHPLIISVECRSDETKERDSDRKHGIEFIDQMYAKHRRLPTHLLILVSEKGFTNTAAPHAAACTDLEIKLVSSDSDMAAFSDDVSSSLTGAAFRLFRGLPQKVTVRCVSLDGETAESVIPTDIPIFEADGSVTMDGQELVSKLIEGMATQIGETLLRSAGHKEKLVFDIDVAASYETVTGAPLDLYVKPIGDDQLRQIVHVAIENRLNVEEVPLKQRRLTELAVDHSGRDVARYAYGTTNVGGDKVTFVFTESADGKRQSDFIVDQGKGK